MQALALLLIRIVLANLPFFSERRFLLGKTDANQAKSLGWRFAELFVYYLLALGAGLLLESSLGPIYPQRWEFYGITLLFFVVMAFPGFVYRYLYRRASGPQDNAPSV
jgi:Protein of unknown function (DUF2818)